MTILDVSKRKLGAFIGNWYRHIRRVTFWIHGAQCAKMRVWVNTTSALSALSASN